MNDNGNPVLTCGVTTEENELLRTQHRADNAPIKRVELRAHTKMSEMSGLVSARDLVERAAQWGHKAIAITDTNSVQALPEAYRAAKDYGIKLIYGADVEVIVEDDEFGIMDYYAVTLLAKNQIGLKSLYKLLSLLSTRGYCEDDQTGYLTKESLSAHREGLLIGWNYFELIGVESVDGFVNDQGDYELSHEPIELQDIDKSLCDFIIIDACNAEHENSGTIEERKPIGKTNALLEQLGRQSEKPALTRIPIVATGNIYYLNPSEAEASHLVYLAKAGLLECLNVENVKRNIRNLHFRTTEEMLAEFAYLGEEKAYKVVVKNTNIIADMIEEMPPIPEDLFLPTLDGADDEMDAICHARAKEIYGYNMPLNIKEKLDRELSSILKNGYAAIYMIAQKLVKKSNDDGYLVGSRGGVGASLVAFLLGITDIDPIKFDIPFETFAGIDGDRIPDIDLNFSGEIQAEIHRFVEELFGKDKVYRAGTIHTIGERSAAGIVYKYYEHKGIAPAPPEAETLISGITGVKRTTGRHPGGLIIIPEDKEIYDFTPIQHPGDDKRSGALVTHFEYSALENTLVKFDLLGHNDPTMIKRLESISGVDARTIQFDDVKTLDMLTNADTLGVPEFGTDFVRNMIKTVKTKTFDDFVKISGLSHGTDVWHDNAENLIMSGAATISEVIALRDEVMVYLMHKGVCRETAFEIMENTRKGRGLSDEHEEIMSNNGVPEWYIESCNKIGYLFPKAHAVAYTMMAFRIAWFKAHHPDAFYKVVMDVKDDLGVKDYDISEVKKQIAEIMASDDYEFSDKSTLDLLRLRLEMLERTN